MTHTTPAPDWPPPWQSPPDDLADRLPPALPGIMERNTEPVPDNLPAREGAGDGDSGKRLTGG
ncbi:PucR family transcriptional regulator, partial [Micrococcus sp. HSID17227]